jgi:hypothetical protein
MLYFYCGLEHDLRCLRWLASVGESLQSASSQRKEGYDVEGPIENTSLYEALGNMRFDEEDMLAVAHWLSDYLHQQRPVGERVTLDQERAHQADQVAHKLYAIVSHRRDTIITTTMARNEQNLVDFDAWVARTGRPWATTFDPGIDYGKLVEQLEHEES